MCNVSGVDEEEFCDTLIVQVLPENIWRERVSIQEYTFFTGEENESK